MALAELDVELVLRGAQLVADGLAGIKTESEDTDSKLTSVKTATDAASGGLSKLSSSAGGAKQALGDVAGAGGRAGNTFLVVNQAMGKTGGAADEAGKKTGGLGKSLDGLNKLGGLAQGAFNSLTGTIMGFVSAGLQGTVAGAALEYRWQMLNREIATVFLPVINEVIGYLQEGVNWFRSLSQEQVDSYRKWILIGVGVLAVVAAIPKLIAGFGLVKMALSGIFTLGPVGLFLGVAAAIMAVSAAAMGASEEVQKLREEQERFKQRGLTKEEYNKNKTSSGVYDADSKKSREEQLVDIQKEIDAIERLQEADKKKFDSKKGKTIEGAFNVFGGKEVAENEKRRKQMAEDLARLKMQEDAVASGDKIKFFEPKKKVDRDQLGVMPQHGFQSFADKSRTAQLAALKSETPEQATALATKNIDKTLTGLAGVFSKLPWPIIN
jgi:hypothetical protein